VSQFSELRAPSTTCARRFVFLNMYAVNQPEVMIANATQRFDAQGNLTDESSKGLIRN